MTTFIKTCKAAATALLMSATLAGPVHAYTPGAIQTINVTSTRGASRIDQIFEPATGAKSRTRVCLVNATGTTKSFTHNQPGINSMTAPAGGKSCANFSSSARVGFGLLDNGEPANASVAMVMSLGAFAGGTVTFYWK